MQEKLNEMFFNNEEISFLTPGNTLLLSPFSSKQNLYIRLYWKNNLPINLII